MIRVEEDAQKTNAYQENRNLLLSPDAHADSIPGLEILANDVRCTHGATPGRVSHVGSSLPDDARPPPRPEAVQLIVRGFFQDILDASSSSRCASRSAHALEPHPQTL